MNAKKKIVDLLARLGVLCILERLRWRKSNDLFVLTYHRVDQGDRLSPALAPCTLSAVPDIFERQMKHIASRFHVISAEELVQALEGREEIRPGLIMITFDDGYRGFLTNVFPAAEPSRLHVSKIESQAKEENYGEDNDCLCSARIGGWRR